jgi:hypothetical protein
MKLRTPVQINKGVIYTSRGSQYVVTANGMDKDGYWHEREYLDEAYRKLEQRREEDQRRCDDKIEELRSEIQRLRASYPVSRIRELEYDLLRKNCIIANLREELA